MDASRKFKDSRITQVDLDRIEALVDKIGALMEHRRFSVFRWIGSGLQRHSDRVTVAKNDCFGTLDEVWPTGCLSVKIEFSTLRTEYFKL